MFIHNNKNGHGIVLQLIITNHLRSGILLKYYLIRHMLIELLLVDMYQLLIDY